MKISLIATVLNEENTIQQFIESILNQSKLPDEIIIVDGGSTDTTASVISNFLASRRSGQFPISNKKIKFKFIVKKGNRSVGRNEAIKNSLGDVIASVDAGCTLDKNWLKNIIQPFKKDPKADVVAGYYKGLAKNLFQKCLVPYVLVMPDRVNPKNFLPASRSMAFTKIIWKKAEGFPEEFSHNEDYVFAKKLKKINARIVFEKDAIVYWIPRENAKEAFIMFYRFALGDAEARILRPKVFLLFIRFLIGTIIFVNYIFLLNAFYLGGVITLYLFWSIVKNYRFVKDFRAIFFLPYIQLVSDIAILTGTLNGLIKKNGIF